MAGDIGQINNENSPTQIGDGNTQNINSPQHFGSGDQINNYNFPEAKNEPLPKLLTSQRPPKGELIGRETDLKELERLLVENRQVILVNGLGGVGKTALCREYFWTHYNSYDHLAWVDYRGSLKDSLYLQFVRMASFREDDNIDVRFDKIIDQLCRPELENTLLVLDNIDRLDDSDIATIRSLPIKVIASSRIQIKGFPRHLLGLLPMDECKKLFTKHYECEDDEEHLEKIINLAGRHTLTVELLANTAKNSCTELKEFYAQLLEIGFNLDETIKEHTTTEWHAHEEDTFFNQLLKVFELSDINDDELYILTNLSILPNLHIEIKNVKEWLGLESLNDLNSLVSKGWLLKEEKSRTVYMHPVIGEVVRYRTEPDVEKCSVLVDAMINNLSYSSCPNLLNKRNITPYAQSIIYYLTQTKHKIAILLNNLSVLYKGAGNFKKALGLQLKAIAIEEKVLENKSPNLASCYDNLALIYLDLSNFRSALHYQLKANTISEIFYDKNSPELAVRYNNLALTYQSLGDFELSLSFQLKAIAIREMALDKDHPELANSYNNLASLYHDIGKFELALNFQLKSISIGEKAFGDKSPYQASSYSNISNIYKDMGMFTSSLDFELKALSIREKELDKEHPDLANSYNSLGVIYHSIGNLELSLNFQLKALTIREMQLGKEHPDLATSYNNLALIYNDVGNLELALDFQLKAIAIAQKALNNTHPTLAAFYNNIAGIYSTTGDVKNAIIYEKKAITILTKKFPHGHPDLKIAKSNLKAYKSMQSQKNRNKRNRKKKR